jgi:type II secretory pathway component PulL
MTHLDDARSALAPVREKPPRSPAALREAKLLAGKRRTARRRRVAMIRRRIAIGSLTLFLAAWSVIFAQMVTGHDPALSRRSARVAASRTAMLTTTSASSAANEDASSGTSAVRESTSTAATASETNGASSSARSSESGRAGAVTTGQS